jgi:ABC-type Fe3+-hydroxamate transport system substrate-binding protein
MGVRVESCGGIVELEHPARRIVSLVPSISETLFHIGAQRQIAGITKFCERPWELFKKKPHVGETMKPDVDCIRELRPDLILCGRDDNREEDVRELREIGPVHVSAVDSVARAGELIIALGVLTAHEKHAQKLAAKIPAAAKRAQKASAGYAFRRVLHLVWKEPYLAPTRGTYIYDLLVQAGLEPVAPRSSLRFAIADDEFIREASPEAVLFPDEPHRFTYEDIGEFAAKFADLPCVTREGLYKIEGTMTSWYGYRTTLALDYLARVMTLE